MEGLRKRWEGLVHVSQLRREGRVNEVSDVVQRGQKVKVKVLKFTASVTGGKTSLSMKDVDQETGADLNPESTDRGGDRQPEAPVRNPDRPVSLNDIDKPSDSDVAVKRYD